MHLAVPGPGARSTNSQQREHSFGGAKRAVPQVVVQEPVAVPVGVATVATHPAIVREPAIVEQPFALIGHAQLGLRPERNSGRPLSFRDVDYRDFVGQFIGRVYQAAMRRNDNGRRPSLHEHAVHVGVAFRKEADFPHACQRYDNLTLERQCDVRRIGRGISCFADRMHHAFAEHVGRIVVAENVAQFQRTNDVAHEHAPMHVIGSRARQRVQNLVRHQQACPIGVQCQTANIVGGQLANVFDFTVPHLDDGQPAPKCVGDDQTLFGRVDKKQLSRRKRQGNGSGNCQAGRFCVVRCKN